MQIYVGDGLIHIFGMDTVAFYLLIHYGTDDWKLNSKQLLSKTFNSRMNIIETRAALELSRAV